MPPLAFFRKWRYGFVATVLVTVGIILYNCSVSDHKYARYATGRHSMSVMSTQILHPSEYRNHVFPETSVNRNLDFNINGNDVIVFLHVQKTGGTSFGRQLTRNLDITQPCQCARGHKRCMCYRPSSRHQLWLFSRLSTGWLCGVHADWTELQSCVPEALDRKERVKVRRRYFYITMVRNPIARYISEWRHTQRGATWKATRHMCNGRQATAKEVPFCFTGETWMGVTLDEFLTCPSNMAHNRQTRMLADLTRVGCYNNTKLTQEEYNRGMLASAKQNLESMAFFGLTEFQKETQYLFERTFKMRFRVPLTQSNLTIANASPVAEKDIEKIRTRNLLDSELYAFAKELFFQRYRHMKQLEKQEAYHNQVNTAIQLNV